MHRANPKTPIEETMRALLELKAPYSKGKIKYIGICEVSANTLRRAYKVGQVDYIQSEYSLFDLDIERESGPKEACREIGVSIIAYAPLGRGLLTGARSTNYDEHFDANVKIINRLGSMAAEKGCTAAQRTIVWYLEENVAALRIEITDADETQMRDFVAAVAGERVPDFAKYQCYVDTVEE
ncbi:hypothetical protein PG996_010633 [Apiospora saccharicola]|uniref:NADP-dependent oxidoreductase domain-containing protein n=1 Tax=Apiospora saccharicola TaxID=335842 RepID=A0ABR1UP49_9PEZI